MTNIWTIWSCLENGMRVPQGAKKHMGMSFIQHMRPHGTIIEHRRRTRCLKRTDRAMLHLNYKEDHLHVQRARRCRLLALGLKWHHVRLMSLFLNGCVHISERKSIEWMDLSYVDSFCPMTLCPVGNGPLRLWTDTLFTPAHKRTGVIIYLSIYLDSIRISLINLTYCFM